MNGLGHDLGGWNLTDPFAMQAAAAAQHAPARSSHEARGFMGKLQAMFAPRQQEFTPASRESLIDLSTQMEMAGPAQGVVNHGQIEQAISLGLTTREAVGKSVMEGIQRDIARMEANRGTPAPRSSEPSYHDLHRNDDDGSSSRSTSSSSSSWESSSAPTFAGGGGDFAGGGATAEI